MTDFAVTDCDVSQVHEVKIAVGAVAPTVVRSTDAEEMLKDICKSKIHEIYFDIEKYYGELVNPLDDQRSTKEYRKNISLQLLGNFL